MPTRTGQTTDAARRANRSIYAIVAVAALAVALTFITDKRPLLGLDLKGGLSVVLQPVKGSKNVTEETITQTIEVIRKRIDSLGVSEPEISDQGTSILVQLPGVSDQERALEVIGSTAELRFRPVLGTQTLVGKQAIAELRKKLKIPKGVSAQDVLRDELTKQGKSAEEIDQTLKLASGDPAAIAALQEQLGGANGDGAQVTASTLPAGIGLTQGNATTAGGSVVTQVTTVGSAPNTSPSATGTPATDAPAAAPAAAGTEVGGGRLRAGAPAQDGAQTTAPGTTAPGTTAPGTTAPGTTAPGTTAPATTAPGVTGGPTTTVPAATTTTTTTAPKNQYKINTTSQEFRALIQAEGAAATKVTPRADDVLEKQVVLTDDSESVLYTLGPAALKGDALESANATLQNGTWGVSPVFKAGAKGIDLFNAVAATCNSGAATCPTKQLGIVLDGVVLTAPEIQDPSYQRDQIRISNDSDPIPEVEAKDIALKLRYGALPLTLEPATAQKVSATLGEGALRAGLISGLVGLLLVAAWLVAYYRMLGLVTVGGLLLTGSLLWSVICLVGATLTLAGIVGIIVSIGVSLDSSVVFFENLKEDVGNGRTLRTAAGRSFSAAYSTIIKADTSSLIGAAVLYLLTAGPVRGFAFYLGLSTLLDLLISWVWTRPAVAALTRSNLGLRPPRFGIPDKGDASTVAVLATDDGGAL